MKRLLFATLLLAFSLPAAAENWPHWRGPSHNGTSTETNLPVKFSKTENVRWTADLPGASASSPIIHGDRVFVSSIADNDDLIAMCLDRKTGEKLWSHVVGKGPATDPRANKAAPSPATDGKIVVYFYGNGDMAGFKVDGERLWSRSITQDYGDFSFLWTFSSSPTFYEGTVYLPVLQRDSPVGGKGKPNAESYILAINPADGKDKWRHVRPSKAVAESLESFTTIIPYNGQLLLAGGDALTGHDPKTGEELWRWGTWNRTRIGHWRLVPSAVGGGGVILVCAPKGSPVYAVKDDLKGDHSGKAPLWKSEDRDVSSDVCTPAFYEGHFFVLNDKRKVLSKVKPDGSVVWTQRAPGREIYRASPTCADGKVYIMNHGGHVSVLSAKDGELLHETPMGEQGADHVRPTIAVSQGNLFIKVQQKLYCIGSGDAVN